MNLDLNNGSIFKSVLNTLSQIEQINVFLSGRVNTEYSTEGNQCDLKKDYNLVQKKFSLRKDQLT